VAVDAVATQRITSESADPPATSSDDHGVEDTERADDVSAVDAVGTRRSSPVKFALIFGAVMCVALAGLCGWLGYRAHQAQTVRDQRAVLLQAGRQAALNLTTISYSEADADVKRILDSATGSFHDDFANRSQPFIELVKRTQSTTVGTITEAGLESQDGDQAQVLVAVSVKTSNAGAPQDQTKAWRMRITVQKVAGGEKASNVEFVP
jgi:Mce-associated membrane protein